ncbi:MAG: hypothetical protein JNG85_16215 [Spirochaetaceae bacterium]|nr:hypothetical protein [Spirochaetaceae bacterium]
MILDREPSGLDQETRAALARNLAFSDEVLAVSEARFALEAGDFKVQVRRGRKTTTFEAAALEAIQDSGGMKPRDLGKMLGFDEEDADFANRLCARLFDLKAVFGDPSHVVLSPAGSESVATGTMPETKEERISLVLPGFGGPPRESIPVPRKISAGLVKLVSWSDEGTAQAQDGDAVLEQARLQHPDLHNPDNGVWIEPQSLRQVRRGSCSMTRKCALVRSRLNGETRLVPLPREKDPEGNAFVARIASRAVTERDRLLAEFEEARKLDPSSLVEAPPAADPREEILKLIREAKQEENEKRIKELQLQYSQLQPRYYNTYAFEEELLSVFARSSVIWIKSPFVRQYAMRERARQIENALQRKATIVLVASLPEGREQENVDPRVREDLENLTRDRERFLFVESQVFHTKLMYSFGPESYAYQGSFNILSFMAREGERLVRDETMVRLPWEKAAAAVFDAERDAVIRTLEGSLRGIEASLEARKKTNPKIIDRALEDKAAMLAKKIALVRNLPIPLLKEEP